VCGDCLVVCRTCRDPVNCQKTTVIGGYTYHDRATCLPAPKRVRSRQTAA
jgi:hypothetical protein